MSVERGHHNDKLSNTRCGPSGCGVVHHEEGVVLMIRCVLAVGRTMARAAEELETNSES